MTSGGLLRTVPAMRLLAPLLALLLAACSSPTSTGDASDAAASDRPAGWAPHGQVVSDPAECAAGLLACRRGEAPGRPAAPGAELFCARPSEGHCGACGVVCPSGLCVRGDAGVYACAP